MGIVNRNRSLSEQTAQQLGTMMAYANPSNAKHKSQKNDNTIRRKRSPDGLFDDVAITHRTKTEYKNGTIRLSKKDPKTLNDGHLGKQKWQLERPRRYRMQIVVSGAQYLDEVTVHQVECFNRINEYCSLVIRQAVTLENLCAEYLSNMEASRTKAHSDSTNQPPSKSNIGMVSIFLNPSPDGKLPDVEKRVRAALFYGIPPPKKAHSIDRGCTFRDNSRVDTIFEYIFIVCKSVYLSNCGIRVRVEHKVDGNLGTALSPMKGEIGRGLSKTSKQPCSLLINRLRSNVISEVLYRQIQPQDNSISMDNGEDSSILIYAAANPFTNHHTRLVV
ncbi:hypothetical protein CLF_100420 [Clonorchis sinensis]|uniref:Uncharacterized protein n=1 Tax=Clonorchis sinensis TaxID=79923 RepID=G7Y3E7_CLOSI|nr:hypothetical protein CLF_100420 [Clonorchis sinensis]